MVYWLYMSSLLLIFGLIYLAGLVQVILENASFQTQSFHFSGASQGFGILRDGVSSSIHKRGFPGLSVSFFQINDSDYLLLHCFYAISALFLETNNNM